MSCIKKLAIDGLQNKRTFMIYDSYGSRLSPYQEGGECS